MSRDACCVSRLFFATTDSMLGGNGIVALRSEFRLCIGLLQMEGHLSLVGRSRGVSKGTPSLRARKKRPWPCYVFRGSRFSRLHLWHTSETRLHGTDCHTGPGLAHGADGQGLRRYSTNWIRKDCRGMWETMYYLTSHHLNWYFYSISFRSWLFSTSCQV